MHRLGSPKAPRGPGDVRTEIQEACPQRIQEAPPKSSPRTHLIDSSNPANTPAPSFVNAIGAHEPRILGVIAACAVLEDGSPRPHRPVSVQALELFTLYLLVTWQGWPTHGHERTAAPIRPGANPPPSPLPSCPDPLPTLHPSPRHRASFPKLKPQKTVYFLRLEHRPHPRLHHCFLGN